ncbi:MAG: hypothetical protein J3K34DRAFT_416377 [Monoraphidium minutum]|nr:MAG: hypothetical protein J3K34DRAFT_416377 [Monoraphidium minutum]
MAGRLPVHGGEASARARPRCRARKRNGGRMEGRRERGACTVVRRRLAGDGLGARHPGIARKQAKCGNASCEVFDAPGWWPFMMRWHQPIKEGLRRRAFGRGSGLAPRVRRGARLPKGGPVGPGDQMPPLGRRVEGRAGPVGWHAAAAAAPAAVRVGGARAGGRHKGCLGRFYRVWEGRGKGKGPSEQRGERRTDGRNGRAQRAGGALAARGRRSVHIQGNE